MDGILLSLSILEQSSKCFSHFKVAAFPASLGQSVAIQSDSSLIVWREKL